MMKSMIAQCKAEILRTLRNRRFVVFSVVMPVMFYFIFTGTMGDIKVGGIDWKAYYLMSMTAFGVIGASINTLSVRFAQERTQGWVRLIRITPLPNSAYVLSKMLSQSIVNLGTILLMFLIGHFAKGIDLSLGQWVACGLWIWIGVLPFMALGLLLGTLKSVEVVQVAANILYMSLSVLGGLWMPITTMPKLMQTIAEYLPSYRFGQGAWNVLGGIGPDWTGILILAAYALVFVILSTYILKRQEAV
ncbi:ABC transporter permease [Paenibacillus tuaregi]|uniref:ABC transporter permease n=1 Tax=Paenibacillus tuaregi TaxID=1816681 RepID=UPI000B06AFE1|nr:ABC transporter permease [Paenibacillus tuaregi]